MRGTVCALIVAGAFVAAPAVAATSFDRDAWGVFAKLTAPAGALKRNPVAFETWASDADIYDGKAPVWPRRKVQVLVRSLAASAEEIALHGTPPPAADCQPGTPYNFPPGACFGEMVQHNWPVFKTIRDDGLYTQAGLAKARTPIGFPGDSIVVKADWAAIPDLLRWLKASYKTPDDVRRAYYTNIATLNGKTREYALLSMSVQSKSRPDWLWMTFEHRSNPGRCDDIGCHDDFGAMEANVAPRALNSDYGPCAKTPALTAFLKSQHIDPVFANYCLKGTQTAFVGPDGKATKLANSVIERMNKGVPVEETSCITCHAYASFDGGSGAPNYAPLKWRPRPTGMPNSKLPDGFKTHDYLWSILAAK